MILNSGSGRYFLIYLLILFSFLMTSEPLHADVVTDGSVGAVQSLTGPDYAIPETLGTVKGSNLFHSFEQFSIKTEESATFTGSDSIQNVISRVTGGQRSDIDGTLRSNVGKADFYFINPSGVVFGPNAKNTSVPGADGGRIKINADSLITDKSMKLQIGGEAESFQPDGNKNIIQAADDSKNPQDIQTPEVPLDIGGSIVNIGAKFSDPVNMATNHCLTIGTKRTSSLIECGKGGIMELPENASSIYFDQRRLHELFLYQESL